MNVVRLGPTYLPQSSIGRPIANADIYVGIPDTDPEIPANQKTLSVQEEDGTIVAVAQPVSTGAGGVPMYNGSPVTLLVIGDYSLKVLDAVGSQIYYIPSQSWDENYCYPDYEELDQGVTGDNGTVKYYVDLIGADEATIYFRHNSGAATTTYTFSTNETIPSNINLEFENGAIPSIGAGVTVTIYSPANIIASPSQQIFDVDWITDALDVDCVGGSSVIFSNPGTVIPQWWGAVADGATDSYWECHTAVWSIKDVGGSIYFPAGVYYWSDFNNRFQLYSNIEMYGDGAASKIDSARNSIQIGWGVSPATYNNGTYWTYYTPSAVITAGDATIAFAGGHSIQPDSLVIVRSIVEDAIGFPSFIELVKVISVTATSITLEHPIEVDVADPNVGVNNLDTMAENVSVHDMSLDADFSQDSRGLLFGGVYKSQFYNLWSTGGIIFNLLTRSSIHDVRVINQIDSYDKLLEVKSGSYRSSLYNIFIDDISNSVLVSTCIDVGERSRRMTLHDINFVVHNRDFNVISCNDSVGGLSIYNINAKGSYCSKALYLRGVFINTNYNFPHDYDIHDIYVDCDEFYEGINIHDEFGTSDTNVYVNNVIVTGVPDTTVNSYGLSLGEYLIGVHVSNVTIPGLVWIKLDPTATDVIVDSCHLGPLCVYGTRGFQGAVFKNITEIGDYAKPHNLELLNTTVSSTTAGNSILEYPLPVDLYNAMYREIVIGSEVRVKITGNFSAGATGDRTIRITEPGQSLVFYTLTVNNTNTDVFDIDIILKNMSVNGQYNLKTLGTEILGSVISIYYSGFISLSRSVDSTFTIEAWTAGGNGMYIANASIEYVEEFSR